VVSCAKHRQLCCSNVLEASGKEESQIPPETPSELAESQFSSIFPSLDIFRNQLDWYQSDVSLVKSQ